MKNLIISGILLLTVSCVTNPLALGPTRLLSSVDDVHLSNLIKADSLKEKDKIRYSNTSLINTKTTLVSDTSLLVNSNPGIKYKLKLTGWKHKLKKEFNHFVDISITYEDQTWRYYKNIDIKGVKKVTFRKLKSRVYCGNVRYTRKCSYTERFLVTIPDSYIRTKKNKGFDVKLRSRHDSDVFNIPTKYLNPYLNKNK